MTDRPISRLLLPPAALSGLVMAGLLRDTRGASLSVDERYNHFPAAPLSTLTWVLEGEIRLPRHPGADPQHGRPMPAISVSGPSHRPVVSWTPGPVLALSVAVFPEALQAASGLRAEDILGRHIAADSLPDGPFRQLFCARSTEADAVWHDLLEGLAPLWQARRPDALAGSRRLRDWSRALALRAMFAGPGRSARQIQRRIRGWTGQSQRDLDRHVRIEDLERAYPATADLAALAADQGYADQSHMGREVRRITGTSPAALRNLVQHNEAWWPYRLLQMLPETNAP